ncbi:hypothetical protein D3C76_433570 [compost metagenome]
MASLELAIELTPADAQLGRQLFDRPACPQVMPHQRQGALHLAPLPRAQLLRAQRVAAVARFIHQHVGQALERPVATAGARQQLHRQIDRRRAAGTGNRPVIHAKQLLAQYPQMRE